MFPVPKSDIPPELARQNSIRNTLFAFAAAMAYGISAVPGFISGRETLQILIQRVTAPLITSVVNVGGYTNLAIIASAVIMAIAWLATLMIVWYKAERAESVPARLRNTGKWILGALLFFAITYVLIWLLTGSAPWLTGG